jgi:hypothetical protein
LSYEELGCNLSLKIHFLHSHLDYVGHWAMSTANVFNVISQQWRRDTRASGFHRC